MIIPCGTDHRLVMASFQVHWNVSAGETERKNVIMGLLWLFLVDSQCSTAWWTLLHCWAPSNMKCSLQLRSPLLILLHRLTAWILHWFFMYWTPTLQKNMEQHHRNLAEIKKNISSPSIVPVKPRESWMTNPLYRCLEIHLAVSYVYFKFWWGVRVLGQLFFSIFLLSLVNMDIK